MKLCYEVVDDSEHAYDEEEDCKEGDHVEEGNGEQLNQISELINNLQSIYSPHELENRAYNQ